MNFFKKLHIFVFIGLGFMAKVTAMEKELPVFGVNKPINQRLVMAFNSHDEELVLKCLQEGANLGAIDKKTLYASGMANKFLDCSLPLGYDKYYETIVQKVLFKDAAVCGDLLKIWQLFTLNQNLIYEIEIESLNTLIMFSLPSYKEVYRYEEISTKKGICTFGIADWDGTINDNWFSKALFEAARRNDIIFAHWCVLNGADVNYAHTDYDKEGKTAFHEAAAYGCLPMLKYLSDLGANINAATTSGWTPLNAAEYWGRLEAVNFLESNRAQKRKKNGFKKSTHSFWKKFVL